MNYPKAIVVAAVLIAGAIFFSVRAQANPGPETKYEIISGPQTIEINGSSMEHPGVWRIDTTTGRIWYCGLPKGENGKFVGIRCVE